MWDGISINGCAHVEIARPVSEKLLAGCELSVFTCASSASWGGCSSFVRRPCKQRLPSVFARSRLML